MHAFQSSFLSVICKCVAKKVYREMKSRTSGMAVGRSPSSSSNAAPSPPPDRNQEEPPRRRSGNMHVESDPPIRGTMLLDSPCLSRSRAEESERSNKNDPTNGMEKGVISRMKKRDMERLHTSRYSDSVFLAEDASNHCQSQPAWNGLRL
jgi:hypothetical protein